MSPRILTVLLLLILNKLQAQVITAAFTPSSFGKMVTFTDESQGPFTTRMWDFGNGTTSNEQNPVVTYDFYGTYVVCLEVSDGETTDAVCQTLILAPQPPVFSKDFLDATIPAGQSTTLTFTIDNSRVDTMTGNLSFVDNLPAGLVVANDGNISISCTGGTFTAIPGSSTISYTGGLVPAFSICQLSLEVSPNAPGTYVNTTGDLTSDAGNSGSASATLVATQPIPTMGEWALLITMLMIGILGVTVLTNRHLNRKLSS